MEEVSLKDFNRVFLWYLAGKPIEQRVALMRECKEDLRKLGLEATVEKWRTVLT